LAPVLLAGAAVAGSGQAPAGTALGLVGAAGVMQAAVSWPRVRTVGGRAWLSVRERRTAAVGLAGAAGWIALVDAAPGLGWRAQAVLLAAVLGAPAAAWWGARRPGADKDKLSPLAARLVADWATEVAAAAGPKPLRAATVVAGSVAEPVEGTVTMTVRLSGVHASNATSTQLRRAVEVALGLPMDTVRLDAVRDDGPADRIAVTMGATRHLEAAPTAWPGPVLGDDGAVPVALDAAGATVAIHLFNKDGVEHGLISGTTGMGKGGSTVVVILPGVMAGCEVVLYLDGKSGMSAPEIHPLMTRMAVDAQAWGRLVDITHAIMEAREKRYGADGIKRFQYGKTTTDPVITLLMDEATTLANALSAKRVKKVAEIAQRGRGCGIRVIEVSQSVRSDMIVGGVPTRDLLTGGGFGISHKPGGASAARLATDGIQVAGLVEALQALPPEPGMAVITRRGQVLATQARVFDAEDDAIALIEEWSADGGRPRELTGGDLAAAGDAYTTWRTRTETAEDRAPARGTPDTDGDVGGGTEDAGGGTGPAPAAGPAGKAEQIKTWILDALDEAGADGARAEELEKLPGAPSRATLYRYLSRLMGAGEVTNTDRIWRIAGLPLDHDLDHEPDDEPDDEVVLPFR